jgi:glycosyltransferase involved in cell wall biosynthesis
MLAAALASVRTQTFTDYEIIVVSNGESAEKRRASREAASGRVYLELDRGNVSAARNFGIERAKGEWIAILDDDDLWPPNKLERQVAEAKRTGADMIAGDFVEFYPDGREIIVQPRVPEGWSYVKALNHYWWGAATGATLIRRRIFDEIGGFDVRLRYNEDNDMWRRISWHYSIHQMDEIMLRYRKGHQSMMHPRHDRTRHFYDLCHFIKMHLDTPREFRKELPTLRRMAEIVEFRRMAEIVELRTTAQRLILLIMPAPVLDLLHRIKPRTRWLQFRRWLSSRSPSW